MIQARRTGPLERAWRWSRRNRTVASLLAAFVTALASGLVGMLVLWRQSEGHRYRAETQSAGLALDRGLDLASKGEPGQALHWFARSLSLGPAGEGELRRVARANLASWVDQVPIKVAEFVADDPGSRVEVGPDARTILVYRPGGKMRFWDAVSGQPKSPPLQQPGTVERANFSPDGSVAVTWSNDGSLRVWDGHDGHQLGAWKTNEHPRPVSRRALNMSPDGSLLLTLGAEPNDSTDNPNCVRLWDLRSGRELGQAEIPQGLSAGASAFRPDGSGFALAVESSVSGTFEVRQWEVRGLRPFGEPIRHPKAIQQTFYGDSGKRILSTSHDVQIIEVPTGRV